MVSQSRQQPGEILFKDRFRTVERAITFKRITCYQCDFSAVYKYRVQQVRRTAELLADENEEVRPDHVEIWQTVPRFAEIPETLRCKRCNEILGLYTFCIY